MVDKLIRKLKTGFQQVKEHRYKNAQLGLEDYLQSAFAMFHLRDPSLHQDLAAVLANLLNSGRSSNRKKK